MKIKKQFVLAFLFIGAGIVGLWYVLRYPTFFWNRSRQGTATVVFSAQRARVQTEVARDPYMWSRGLMFRDSLAEDAGMLFVFPDLAMRSFWMKNTLIPLDMIFIDADKKVVTIHTNTIPCATLLCPHYVSAAPAMYVLEVNAGFVERYGVRVGDTVEITSQ